MSDELIMELISKIDKMQRQVDYLETVENNISAWTDYTSSSTIVGWSGTPTAKIYYKKIGKLMFVAFRITGTSDSVNTSFLVPYNANNVGTLDVINPCWASDNGTAAIGYAFIQDNSNQVIFVQNATAGAGAWTDSGTKAIQGQLWYETT